MEILVKPKSMTWHLACPIQDRGAAAIIEIRFSVELMSVFLEDGRILSFPLYWFPSLENASISQRENYHIQENGISAIWSEIDEKVTLRDLMSGSEPCKSCWFRVAYFK